MNLNWILEIKEYEKHLAIVLKDYNDLFLVNDIMNKNSGSKGFIKVFECFIKTSIRFPEKPLNGLKKIYVLQNQDKPVAKMAREIGVDEATVYHWLRQFKGIVKKEVSKKEFMKELLD